MDKSCLDITAIVGVNNWTNQNGLVHEHKASLEINSVLKLPAVQKIQRYKMENKSAENSVLFLNRLPAVDNSLGPPSVVMKLDVVEEETFVKLPHTHGKPVNLAAGQELGNLEGNTSKQVKPVKLG